MKPLVQFLPTPSDNDLQDIVSVSLIEKYEPILTQGLLRVEELRYLTEKARRAYDNAADHNSIQYRKYDKVHRGATRWYTSRSNGYVEPQEGTELLELRQQIRELLDLHDNGIPESTDVFIAPNKPYKALHVIRTILSRAEKTIDIKDEYLFSVDKYTKNVSILGILQPYLEGSLNIQAKLLGGRDNPPSSTTPDIKAFLGQFPNTLIRGDGSHRFTGKTEAHGRFIIIDKKEVYVPDGSLKDLGSKQASIHRVNNAESCKEYIDQFTTWWSDSLEYSIPD